LRHHGFEEDVLAPLGDESEDSRQWRGEHARLSARQFGQRFAPVVELLFDRAGAVTGAWVNRAAQRRPLTQRQRRVRIILAIGTTPIAAFVDFERD
jgi:hypothetical protein